MNSHVSPLLPLLPLLFLTLPASAGNDKANARLKELQGRVIKQEFADDKLRRELLTFCREQVGTPLYARAIEAASGSRAVALLDRLDANAIDEDDRKFLAIGELVAYERPHGRAIASIAFSFDGSLLATSSWDNTVHLYKLGGKEPKAWAKLDASPSGIAFSPDGTRLATGCADTHVILWDLTPRRSPWWTISSAATRIGPSRSLFRLPARCFRAAVSTRSCESGSSTI